MKYYSINKAYPVMGLPKRIRKPNGLTVTDLESLSSSELESLGIVSVSNPPSFNARTHKLSWSGTAWELIALSSSELAELKQQEWVKVRKDRDNRLTELSWQIEKYLSEVRRKVTPTVNISDIDTLAEELRQVPQKQNDPFNIIWPDGKEPIVDVTES
tara:strand:+ start:53 stop:526 length:474 start_codon:yes stop_codon:yes gene_type:complete